MSERTPGSRGPLVLVLTGPESTGKTTLAAALARRFGAELSHEAARAYAASRRAALGPDVPAEDLLGPGDVDAIARAQIDGEDAARARAAHARAPVLIRDTDLVSTVVYARHYYGDCPSWIVDAACTRRGDLYLLCDVDLPWVADEQRDRPTARGRMRDLFAHTLDALGCAWTLVSGVGAERERAAVARIDAALDGRGVERAPLAHV